MLSFFRASCVIWNRRVIRTKRSTTAVEMICVDTQWIFCTRSHNRSRRSQARVPRGSIEIANCAIFRTNCATSTSQTRAGTRKLARLSCGISGDGRSFYDFIWVLSQLFKGSITRYTMHAQWKNELISFTAISRKVVAKVNATIPKIIVGGFEFTLRQRNLKEWHARRWTYACECWRKATKVGLKPTVSGYTVLIISHITFRDCGVHTFSDNLSRDSCKHF